MTDRSADSSSSSPPLLSRNPLPSSPDRPAPGDSEGTQNSLFSRRNDGGTAARREAEVLPQYPGTPYVLSAAARSCAGEIDENHFLTKRSASPSRANIG